MKRDWKKVKLGEVLKLADNSVSTAKLGEVNLAGVYSFARGLFQRGPMCPGDTSYKTYNRLVTDDFVMSQPKAWEGAIALVTPEFNGWYLSPVFSTFRADRAKLEPKYLGWYCKREAVWHELQQKSRGLGARRETVSPDKFLTLEIPLPPLSEQRRIVARIDELSAHVQEALALRQQAAEEAEALLIGMAHRSDLGDSAKHDAGWKKSRLQDCITLTDDTHKVSVDQSYPNLGIYSYAKGLFHKPSIEGMKTSAPALRRVSAGQFIYSRLFAFEGAYGRVTDEYDGDYVSLEYPTFNCNPNIMRVEFLEAYFKSPSVWHEVAIGSKGLGSRRQRVQPSQILSHSVWVPPLEWQKRIACVSSQVDALKRLHAETAAELDALMPSILDRAFKGRL